jgi:hypothetical protein
MINARNSMSARIGDRGEAVSALTPSGKVRINGILYDAKSEGIFIEAGAHCIVVRQDPFALIVRKLEGDQSLPEVPNAGNLVTKSEVQRTSEEVRKVEAIEAEAQRQVWWKDIKKGLLISVILGLVVGGLASLFAVFDTSIQTRSEINKTLLIIGFLLVYPIWGAILYLSIEVIPSMIVKLKESEDTVLHQIIIFIGLIGSAFLFHWEMTSGNNLLSTLLIALLGSLAITFVAWILLKALGALTEMLFGY